MDTMTKGTLADNRQLSFFLRGVFKYRWKTLRLGYSFTQWVPFGLITGFKMRELYYCSLCVNYKKM